jgi:PadR family transcriptional regulator, regulatory protein AphA
MSLQHAILGILNYEPKSGYDLNLIFNKSINHFWPASLSQIYRELGSLEKNGFVSSSVKTQEERPDKKIYTITEDGGKKFIEWLSDFPEILHTPKRDDFMVRVFFGSKLGDKELKIQFERFLREREQSKKTLYLLIEHFEDKCILGSSKYKEVKYWRFTLRRAQITNQALIDWALECISELEE